MKNTLIKTIIWVLKSSKFSLENKNSIMTHLLEKLNVFPIRQVIEICEDVNDENYGKLLLNGKPVNKEQMMSLREGAKALLANSTRKVVQDQMTYLAFDQGVRKSVNLEHQFVSKSALWIMNEENELYKKLAGKSIELED